MRRWAHIIDVSGPFHDDSMNYKERRDAIIAIIKTHPGIKPHLTDENGNEDTDLWYILDELADTRTEHDFDPVWDGLYDWADDNNVWIGAH